MQEGVCAFVKTPHLFHKYYCPSLCAVFPMYSQFFFTLPLLKPNLWFVIIVSACCWVIFLFLLTLLIHIFYFVLYLNHFSSRKRSSQEFRCHVFPPFQKSHRLSQTWHYFQYSQSICREYLSVAFSVYKACYYQVLLELEVEIPGSCEPLSFRLVILSRHQRIHRYQIDSTCPVSSLALFNRKSYKVFRLGQINLSRQQKEIIGFGVAH